MLNGVPNAYQLVLWPIPYARDTFLTVIRMEGMKIVLVVYLIEWQQLPRVRLKSAYFHLLLVTMIVVSSFKYFRLQLRGKIFSQSLTQTVQSFQRLLAPPSWLFIQKFAQQLFPTFELLNLCTYNLHFKTIHLNVPQSLSNAFLARFT